ncbi:6169_t:CDS:2 [Ambispora gerdemannii]|uniref:6169_t:CDS:1 n=1 Tax=Ambispora gerdemannii TaxID=144530 RepID=A0A9N9BR27_9GLOM|nr:6169_t:CDS:2 [Ambispora gerdemannii]
MSSNTVSKRLSVHELCESDKLPLIQHFRPHNNFHGLLGKPVALNFQLNFLNDKNLNQQEQTRENTYQMVIPKQIDGITTSNRIIATKTSDISQINPSTNSCSPQSTTTHILESIATIFSGTNEPHNNCEFSPYNQEQESIAEQDSASSHEDTLHPTAQVLLQDRRHRNLIASKKYRAKKLASEKAMYEKMTNLTKERMLLTKENEALKLENESLKAIISRLSEQLVEQRIANRQLDNNIGTSNNSMGIIAENAKPKDNKHRSKRKKTEPSDHGKKNNPIRVCDDFESD